VLVIKSADAAISSALSSLPALKPSQPNHNKPAPTAVKTTEDGKIAFLPKSFLLPNNSASARPDIPEAVYTTVPPAKSNNPSSDKNPPPHTQ